MDDNDKKLTDFTIVDYEGYLKYLVENIYCNINNFSFDWNDWKFINATEDGLFIISFHVMIRNIEYEVAYNEKYGCFQYVIPVNTTNRGHGFIAMDDAMNFISKEDLESIKERSVTRPKN